MKKLFAAIALSAAICAGAAGSPLQDSMLETFVRYARIDSQSSNDSLMTAGQHTMALAVKADAEEAIARSAVRGASCILSPDNYLYVKIPANTEEARPSVGISCHLDVTPEAPGGDIRPIVDQRDGHTIVRTDGTTLLGADDKCGCAIAMELIRTLLADSCFAHGEVMVAFCPNEDVGRAADNIDSSVFSPDILFDIDGPGGSGITRSNFTARGFNVRFIGKDVHPGDAKALGLGDAVAAAATFIAAVPVEYRPENTEGLEGYIHPWGLKQVEKEQDVTVMTRIRYFDRREGELFDSIVSAAIAEVGRKFPNVRSEVIYDDLQYENVAYTLYPGIEDLVRTAARTIGKEIEFTDERGGTTAAMMAAKGLKGGLCLFSGQNDAHSVREYADLQQMEDAYRLMEEIIRTIPAQ